MILGQSSSSMGLSFMDESNVVMKVGPLVAGLELVFSRRLRRWENGIIGTLMRRSGYFLFLNC